MTKGLLLTFRVLKKACTLSAFESDEACGHLVLALVSLKWGITSSAYNLRDWK
jgi:hypothetical protein